MHIYYIFCYIVQGTCKLFLYITYCVFLKYMIKHYKLRYIVRCVYITLDIFYKPLVSTCMYNYIHSLRLNTLIKYLSSFPLLITFDANI